MSKNSCLKGKNLILFMDTLKNPEQGIFYIPPAQSPYQSNHHVNGGGDRDRTYDLLRARQALSQLSYTPKNGFSGWHFKKKVVGLDLSLIHI